MFRKTAFILLLLFVAVIFSNTGCFIAKKFNKAYVPGYRAVGDERYEDVLINVDIPSNYTMFVTYPSRKEVKIKTKKYKENFNLILDVGKEYKIKVKDSNNDKTYLGKIKIYTYDNINNDDYKLKVDNLDKETFTKIDNGEVYNGKYYMGGNEIAQLVLATDIVWNKLTSVGGLKAEKKVKTDKKKETKTKDKPSTTKTKTKVEKKGEVDLEEFLN